jgi:hypothetical protein
LDSRGISARRGIAPLADIPDGEPLGIGDVHQATVFVDSLLR